MAAICYLKVFLCSTQYPAMETYPLHLTKHYALKTYGGVEM